MRPVLCLITDRRRFGAVWEEALIDRVAQAARAGVHLVQIRERGLDARALTDLTKRALEAVRGTSTRVLVNDRLDVAMAAGAHGVHLRGDSMAAPRVRAIAPRGFLVGRSVHSRDEAKRVTDGGGVDYLLFGTVFATPSKPAVPAAGLRALADVVAATSVPVLAVGGMEPGRLRAVAGTGAVGIAAIGLFAGCSPESLRVVVRETSMAFDTLVTVP